MRDYSKAILAAAILWCLIAVLIVAIYVFLLWILTATANAHTVQLTASEQLEAVPQLHFVVEGVTHEIQLSGDLADLVFSGTLPDLSPGQCGHFWIPPCGLQDLAGNCGSEIKAGTDYCAAGPAATPTVAPTPDTSGWIAPASGEIVPEGLVELIHTEKPGGEFFLSPSQWLGAGACANGICSVSINLSVGIYSPYYRYQEDGVIHRSSITFYVVLFPSATPTPTQTPTVTPTVDAVKPWAELEIIE